MTIKEISDDDLICLGKGMCPLHKNDEYAELFCKDINCPYEDFCYKSDDIAEELANRISKLIESLLD